MQLPSKAIEYMLCHEKGFSTANAIHVSCLVYQQQRHLFYLGTQIEQASVWLLKPHAVIWLPLPVALHVGNHAVCKELTGMNSVLRHLSFHTQTQPLTDTYDSCRLDHLACCRTSCRACDANSQVPDSQSKRLLAPSCCCRAFLHLRSLPCTASACVVSKQQPCLTCRR